MEESFLKKKRKSRSMLLKLSDVIKLLGNYRIFQYILFGEKVVPS